MFPVGEQELDAAQRSGRSEEKNDARNEALLYRYYFYNKFYRGLGWPRIQQLLAEEFFLEERTVLNLVHRNDDSTEVLRQIAKEAPTLKQLKQKFWLMVWDLPAEKLLNG